VDLFIRNISQLVTVAAAGQRVKTGLAMRDVGIITDGAVECKEGTITWVGTTAEYSGKIPEDMSVIDARGMVALPGFIDSHTHTVFSGSRENEFALRSAGAAYQEIANAGGGILNTVKSVRTASKRDLKRSARHHLTEMMRHGTTTVEIKSGYGLTVDDEIKMLEAIAELREEELTDIVPTFMAAHAVPPEFAGNAQAYVELIVGTMLPYVVRKGLARYCDVFCEHGYFDVGDSRVILSAARAAGLRLKIHAEEFSVSGGAELAADLKVTSADHLEHVTEKGIEALANSGVVATILPGVSFVLHQQYAPARQLIDSGVAVALATDFNPGSCMSFSMPLMMTIACTQMRMTPEEALVASTLNAAAALDLSATHGSLEVGKKADILLADIPDFRFLAYHFGVNHVGSIVKNGTLLEL
jgi:imidazolonepropionase